MLIFFLPQGSSNHAGLLHAGLAARLLPDEAAATDAHLHLWPPQGVPGGAAVPPHRGRHQAQGAAARLPGLRPVGLGPCLATSCPPGFPMITCPPLNGVQSGF